MTKEELLRYKGTSKTGIKEILENASMVVLKAEWEAAHHKAWKCICKTWTGDACDKKNALATVWGTGHATTTESVSARKDGEVPCAE